MTQDNIEYKETINEIADCLAAANRILFITGAGISAESGLPTYRGIGGLYNDKDTDDGIPVEEAISGPMFQQNPAITWKYLLQIEEGCRRAKHNRAHEIIAELEKKLPYVLVLTQNIDGFHSSAGSKNIIDIHGDLHDLYCTKCSYEEKVEDYSKLSLPPQCPECGEVIRPRVVLFSEMLPYEKINRLSEEVQQGFDIVFSVGTTSVFPYIAGPVFDAARSGQPTVEINPSVTEVSGVVKYKISTGAVQALTDIENASAI